MGLEALSNEDLLALKGGDLSKVSTAGLRALREGPSVAERIASDPISQGARAAIAEADRPHFLGRDVSPEAIAGTPMARLAMGAAAPFLGAAQLGAHALGGGEGIDQTLRQTEELKKSGMEAAGRGKFDLPGLTGNILSPLPLKVAGMLPKATTLPGKVGTGVTMGAVYGGTEPVQKEGDFAVQKAEQTGTGAVAGGILPPVGALARGLGKTIYSAFEPILPGGPEAILNRFQTGLLGDAKDKVVAALMRAKELVPGSSPTAGEAVADVPGATGLAAHQRVVSRTPAAAPGFVQRASEQEAARAAELGAVAQTPEALAAAEKARSTEGVKNYTMAFEETAKRDKELSQLMKDPYFKEALPAARDLAKSKGITAKDDLTQFLHYVKVGLDKQLDRTGDTALAATEKEAVQGVKAKLLSWMDEKNPAYSVARERFAEMSRPITQMEIGQGLESKLAAPLGASERAASYAGALRDPSSLIKSTGAPASMDLRDLMTPQQLASLENVGADLSRQARFERLARGTNLGGSGPAERESLLPNLLSRPAMVANYIARKLGHDLEGRVNEVAGRQYLNPQELAQSLMDKPISERKRIVDALLARYGQPVVTGAPAVGMAQQF